MKVEELLENEWYVVRHSGETPEIALHSAIYYLTRAKDGPQLTLSADQLKELQDAAITRFEEIITRDLQHENVSKSIYRGVARSIINYQRYLKFCDRQQLANQLKERVAVAFNGFLQKELTYIQAGEKTNINCHTSELSEFAATLGMTGNDHLAQLSELLERESVLESV